MAASTDYAGKQCDECGQVRTDVQSRDNGHNECLPCWRESLRHGHEHGMHVDGNGLNVAVPDCPLCPVIGADDMVTCPMCGDRLLHWQWSDHQSSGNCTRRQEQN